MAIRLLHLFSQNDEKQFALESNAHGHSIMMDWTEGWCDLSSFPLIGHCP